jgi:hypothetical protein
MDSDFSEKKFEKQMSVLRGQALNLSQAMRYVIESDNKFALRRGE